MNRIVVGVDGSPGAAAALRWACDEADLWQVPLVAVWAWEFSPLLVVTGAPVDLEGLAAASAEALEHALDDQLGARAAPVQRRVVEGGAVAALLAEVGEHDLLVVGSRGLGGLTGTLLGSVSRQVVQHAPCPVAVIPSPSA